MDRPTCIATLQRAFAAVQRDPEQTLHQAQLCDEGLARPISTREWHAAGARDLETHWQQVSGAALERCDYALAFFTPMSWRFYLPAYLCHALALFSPPQWERELLDHVLFSLTLMPQTDERLNRYRLERFQALSALQQAAVRSFLELIVAESMQLMTSTNRYCPSYDHAQTALDSYWANPDVRSDDEASAQPPTR